MSKFIHGPLVFTEVRTFTASGDITMANEAILNVNKASGAATAVTLPPTPKTGRTIFIKDAKGDAATNAITITPASGNIDGAASMTISTNYGSILLQYNGSEWSKLHPTVQVGNVADNTALYLGTDSDTALYHKSASTLTNTAVSGVLDGTPVTPALAANSFILSNTTASGDILIAADRGGNSEAYLWVDSSAGDLTLYAPAGEILLNPTTDVQILNGTGLIVGHTAQLTVSGTVPELQVLGTTTGVDGSMVLATASTTNGDRSELIFAKIGNAALGSFTTVAQGESLGAIEWVGDDGTDLATRAACIEVLVNSSGTVAASRVPSDIVFRVDPGGSDDAIAEKLRLTCNGDLLLADGGGIVVGGSTQLTVGGTIPEVQIQGTTTAVDGSMLLATASTTNSSESELKILKGGNAALGSFTTVAQGEFLGSITFYGDDGTDYATAAARIRGVVNASGTVATSRVPTDLVFYTDPGGGDDAIAEQMRLGCGGVLFLNDSSHAAMTKGICINQGAADDIAFSLKSSDVATVLTTIVTGTVETDDYFTISKFAGATGGTLIQALGENAAVTSNLRIESYGGQADATKSTAARGLIEMYATQHDGANALADIGADGNALVVIVRRGAADVAGFIVDEDGEIHSDVAAATFDEHDDLQLVRAFDHGKQGFVQNQWDAHVTANEQALIDIGVLGAPKSEGGLVNHCRLLQLHNGALWQLYSKLLDLIALQPPEIRAKLLPAA